jgi:arsenate reductase
MKHPLRIYFLCAENRCRSQIAEAYAKQYGGSNVEVNSAGTSAMEIHPLTYATMQEAGFTLAGHMAKIIDRKWFNSADVIVKLCTSLQETSPPVPFGIQNYQWDIPDPLPSGQLNEVHRVRNLIKEKVHSLLTNLNIMPTLQVAASQAALHAATDMEDYVELFKLLADKHRLTIISLLKERDLCVCELVDLLQTSQPNISQHIRKLKDAGLLQESRRGQWVYYSLRLQQKPHWEPILHALPALKQNEWDSNQQLSCK